MKKLAPKLLMLFFLTFSSVIYAQDWKYDLEEALAIAKEKDQKIVLFFTGSDWCPPCIKLERNLLTTEKFADFTYEKYVWLRADFPRRKKNRLSPEQRSKNKELAKRYNKRKSFPAILILNKEGVVLGATGYRSDLDVQGYIDLLTSFDSFGR